MRQKYKGRASSRPDFLEFFRPLALANAKMALTRRENYLARGGKGLARRENALGGV
ncbi:protein of unknown function [Magnetospirillum sp. XM-1]|nr:protein of unknown function [Magnetospirillum sp. XM-1]